MMLGRVCVCFAGSSPPILGRERAVVGGEKRWCGVGLSWRLWHGIYCYYWRQLRPTSQWHNYCWRQLRPTSHLVCMAREFLTTSRERRWFVLRDATQTRLVNETEGSGIDGGHVVVRERRCTSVRWERDVGLYWDLRETLVSRETLVCIRKTATQHKRGE